MGKIVTIMRPKNDENCEINDEVSLGKEIDFIFNGTKEEAEAFLRKQDGPAYNEGTIFIECTLTENEQQ